jgi:hypothetical protein
VDTRFLRTLLAGSLTAAACASAPVVSQKDSARIAGVHSVFLAPPLVEYIDSATGNRIDKANPAENAVQASLLGELRSGLAAKHVGATQRADFPALEPPVVDGLQDVYRRIRLGSPPRAASAPEEDGLSSLAATTGASHVMFCRCRPHVGPGGYWNPITGQMSTDSSRIVLDCHLYDIQERRVVWARSSQIRSPSKDAQSSIPAMTALMLTTLEVR